MKRSDRATATSETAPYRLSAALDNSANVSAWVVMPPPAGSSHEAMYAPVSSSRSIVKTIFMGQYCGQLSIDEQELSTADHVFPSMRDAFGKIPLSRLLEMDTLPVHLSRKWIGANFRGVAARILERRAGIDLKVIVADLARNVILPVVAVAFAAPSPVNEPHFSRVIDLIQRRTDHLTWQIFSIGRSHLRSRIGSGVWPPDGRGSDIARSQIRHWK